MRPLPLSKLASLAPVLLGLATTTLVSCASTPRSEVQAGEKVELEADPVALEVEAWRAVPDELMPAFEVVVQALEDGEERVARGALGRIFAAQPAGRTLELAQAFERIVDGRARCAELDLVLEAEELDAPPGCQRLYLRVRSRSALPLVLHSPGARLRQLQVSVDPDGQEHRASRREAVAFPERLTLAPGAEERFAVAELRLVGPAGLLALSSLLELEVLPGEFILEDGRHLPAQELARPELELVRLAPELPTASLPPESVASYVAAGGIYVPALMERVARVAPEDRAAALDALAPVVEELPLVELERLVPGLRWLARTTTPGGDPEAWRAWLRARTARRASAEPRAVLQLPTD